MEKNKPKLKKDDNFYKSKFQYYQNYNTWVVVTVCISSLFYYFSDIHLFGYWSLETLPCRLFILIPLFLFLIFNKFIKNYKILILMSYLCAHATMWCTIWACTKLPDLAFACEGFLIINLAFLVMGISAPITTAILGHGLLFIDIAIANTFVAYPEFPMMLFLGLPCYFGICVFDFAIEKTFADQYLSRQKIESDLIHDPLTKAFNRKLFETITNSRGEFLSYPKNEICVLMFDIDHFKKINDTYGHEAGDEVLKFLADLVMGVIRTDDKLVRWGGEEFVLILNSCPLYGAENKAEFIRQRLIDSQYNKYSITISVGVAQYTGGDYNQVIQHADEAMYKAKNSGRNMVLVYND